MKRYRPAINKPPRKMYKPLSTPESQKLERTTITKKRLKIDSVVSLPRESVFEDGNLDFNPSLRIEEGNYSDMLFFNFSEFFEEKLKFLIRRNLFELYWLL